MQPVGILVVEGHHTIDQQSFPQRADRYSSVSYGSICMTGLKDQALPKHRLQLAGQLGPNVKLKKMEALALGMVSFYANIKFWGNRLSPDRSQLGTCQSLTGRLMVYRIAITSSTCAGTFHTAWLCFIALDSSNPGPIYCYQHVVMRKCRGRGTNVRQSGVTNREDKVTKKKRWVILP